MQIITTLAGEFSIHRVNPDCPIPSAVRQSDWYWIGKTEDELSIVCASHIRIADSQCNAGWSCLKLLGPIDFSVTGLMATMAHALASARISLFALSTFDTDYLLVKTDQLDAARAALGKAGFEVH